MSVFGSTNSGLFGQNNQNQANKPPTLNLSGISNNNNNTTQASSGGGGGGLFGSANTGNAGGGLFGAQQNTNQNQGGGLFGSSAQPQQSGSLFGNNQQSQPQQSTGLFGSTNNAQQNQTQTGGGLFGSAGNNQQQTGGGLFGSTNNQASSGGGLFGNNAQAQGLNQQQSGGGLFGSATASQPAQTGGLFGASNAAKPAGGNLFGGPTSTQPQSNLFGQSNANAASANNQPQGSLNGYNHLLNQPTTGGLPSLRFSRAGDRQPQATIPGVRIDLSNMRSTTRFTDLHDEVQKVIVEVEKVVEGQIKLHDQIAAVMPQHQANLSSIPQDVSIIAGEVETVELAMYNDSATIKQAKDLSLSDIENARRTFTAIEALKIPSARSTWAARSRAGGDAAEGEGADKQDLVRFFTDSADEMAKTLAQYEKYIVEIESHLRTVEANTIAQSQQALFTKGADGKGRSADDQVRELASVLREFEGGIRGVAGKVGGLRDEVQRTTLRPRAKR